MYFFQRVRTIGFIIIPQPINYGESKLQSYAKYIWNLLGFTENLGLK